MELSEEDKALAAQFAGSGDGLESAPTSYRDMTEEQRLTWGAAEAAAREADLANIQSAEQLKQAQDNAVKRRRLIGASMSWASRAVVEGRRAARSKATGSAA